MQWCLWCYWWSAWCVCTTGPIGYTTMHAPYYYQYQSIVVCTMVPVVCTSGERSRCRYQPTVQYLATSSTVLQTVVVLYTLPLRPRTRDSLHLYSTLYGGTSGVHYGIHYACRVLCTLPYPSVIGYVHTLCVPMRLVTGTWCPYLLQTDHLLGVLVPSQDLPRPHQPCIWWYQWWYQWCIPQCMHYGSHRVHHLCTLPMQHTVSQYQYGVSYTLYQWSDLVSRGLVVGTNPQYSTQLLVVPYYRLHSTVCTTSKAKDQGLPTPIQYPMWWYVWCMLWYILCMQGTMYPPLSQCSRVCTHSVCAHEVSQWDRMSLSIGTDHLLGVLVLLRPPQTLHRNPISTPILYQYSTSTTPTTTSRYSLSLVCRGIHSTTSGVYIVVYMVPRKWCIRYLDTY